MGNNPDVALNPWHPMNDPVDLKHIGKLLEELGEAVAAASRCQIQGIDECNPETNECNRDWLEKELADVRANIDLCVERFKLRADRMEHRALLKKTRLREWHRMA